MSQYIFLAVVVVAGWGLAYYTRRQYRRAKIADQKRRDALSGHVGGHFGDYSQAAE
jgi:hypothetical protein